MSPGRIALFAAAAIAAAVAALVAVNRVDEELSPEARAIFERPPRVFSRESGWALLAGFNAPAGVDPRAHAHEPRPAGATRRVSRTPVAGELAVRAPPELLCAPESMDCVRAFAARPRFVDEMAADNAILLARYDELLRSSDLSDVVHGLDSWETFHQGGLVLAVQRVRLSQAGAAAARGRIDQALAWIETDVAFHRRWLEEADTLLSKMLALRAFTRPLVVAGQVAREASGLTSSQAEALARITAPLTARQRGLAAPMRAEAVFFAESLDELIAGPRATTEVTGAPPAMAEFAGRTVLRNATLNFASPFYANWVGLDQIETAELARAIARNKASEHDRLEPGWRWLYNPTGRALAKEYHYDVSEYVWRLRDGDALAAIIRCATALAVRRAPREAAAGVIASEPACRDPYLGRPFAWDANAGELSFEPMNAKNAERFGGRAGRVVFAPYS